MLEAGKGRLLRVKLRCVGTILERDLDSVSCLPTWSALFAARPTLIEGMLSRDVKEM